MNTWIFQAKPEQFRIDDFLATSPESCLWRASAGQSDMRIGDVVYLWRAIGRGKRGSAGAVAKAEIIGPVIKTHDNTASKAFWNDRTDSDRAFERIAIRITCAGRHIPYDDVKNDPILGSMPIIKAGIGTNFLLSADHADRLDAIWSRSGVAWDRDELVAALLAYGTGIKSDVLSANIGRSVSDARKKLMSFTNFDPSSRYASSSPAPSAESEIWNEFYDRPAGQLRIGDLRREVAGHAI